MIKPIIKNIIFAIVPVVISVLGLWPSDDALFSTRRIAAIVLLIIYIPCAIYLCWNDIKDRKKINEANLLKIQLMAVTKLLSANIQLTAFFVSIAEQWHININRIIYSIKNSGQINENDWDLERFYTDICIGCKNMIKEIMQEPQDIDISVSFSCYYIEDGKEYVKMIAHSSPGTGKPDIYYKPELLSDCRYQYGKLMRERTRKPLIYTNNNEIEKFFYKKHDNADLSRYTQYIAVPVYCSENKLMGVFQVVTKHGKIIMDDKEKIEQFIDTYITPFVELLILASKIQKSLLAQPNHVNN